MVHISSVTVNVTSVWVPLVVVYVAVNPEALQVEFVTCPPLADSTSFDGTKTVMVEFSSNVNTAEEAPTASVSSTSALPFMFTAVVPMVMTTSVDKLTSLYAANITPGRSTNDMPTTTESKLFNNLGILFRCG